MFEFITALSSLLAVNEGHKQAKDAKKLRKDEKRKADQLMQDEQDEKKAVRRGAAMPRKKASRGRLSTVMTTNNRLG